MTQTLRMCEECCLFIALVSGAGVEKSTLCFPCHKHMLGKDEEAAKWLEFRRISGSEEEVEKWYEAHRHNNSLQEQN